MIGAGVTLIQTLGDNIGAPQMGHDPTVVYIFFTSTCYDVFTGESHTGSVAYFTRFIHSSFNVHLVSVAATRAA